MLYDGDVEMVEKAVEKGFRDRDSSNAWRRIKNAIKFWTHPMTSIIGNKPCRLCTKLYSCEEASDEVVGCDCYSINPAWLRV